IAPQWPPRNYSRIMPYLCLAATAVGPSEDQCPEHLVLLPRRIGRGDPHVGDAPIEHVGAMRRRIAPAGECVGERVVASTDVLDRGLAHPLLERAPHPVACGRGARLLAGEWHQVGIDDDGPEEVVAAI